VQKKKRPRDFAAFWNFSDTRGVRLANYFGGSLGLGAGAFGAGVVAPGALGAGFGALPVADGGAATPDCTLYASTTFFVMSTASGFHHSTGLCGQGFDVSMIIV